MSALLLWGLVALLMAAVVLLIVWAQCAPVEADDEFERELAAFRAAPPQK